MTPTAAVPRSPAATMAGLVLSLAYLTAYMDRMILPIVVEPIKAELALTDTQIGFLTGFAYILLYALGAVVIARIADRYCRKCIVSIAVLVWSSMTALTGLAQNFWHMLLLRMGTGIGEAGVFPSGSSIIGDYYPPQRRSAAIAIFVSGATMGLTVGLMFGGYIAEHYGWRWAFICVGLLGAPVVLLTSLVLKEPRRGMADQHATVAQQERFLVVCRALIRNRTYVQIVMVVSVLNLMIFGVIQWMPALMLRKFELSVAEVGALFGIALGLGSTLGSVVGGFVANRLARRDPRWLVRMPLWLSALYLPFYEFAIYTSDPTASMVAIFVINVIGGSSYGPVLATMQSVVSPSIRATASALYLCFGSLIGAGGAPLVVGALSDALRPSMGNVRALEAALAIVILATSIWLMIHLRLALRHFSRDFSGTYSGGAATERVS